MLELAESSQLITFPLSACLPPARSVPLAHLFFSPVCIFRWVQTAEWAWGRGSTNTPLGHCTGIQLYNNRAAEKKAQNAADLPVSLVEKFSSWHKSLPLTFSCKVQFTFFNFFFTFCKRRCHPYEASSYLLFFSRCFSFHNNFTNFWFIHISHLWFIPIFIALFALLKLRRHFSPIVCTLT